MDALKKIKPPPGEGFVWIAAEARVARAARDYIINIRRYPLEWLRATGYWVAGRADAYERRTASLSPLRQHPAQSSRLLRDVQQSKFFCTLFCTETVLLRLLATLATV
ncbi:MAG: SIP domain-containing protein [Bryobacteraceae bacterium]